MSKNKIYIIVVIILEVKKSLRREKYYLLCLNANVNLWIHNSSWGTGAQIVSGYLPVTWQQRTEIVYGHYPEEEEEGVRTKD